MDERQCTGPCARMKPIGDFPKGRYRCKLCTNEIQKKTYNENKGESPKNGNGGVRSENSFAIDRFNRDFKETVDSMHKETKDELTLIKTNIDVKFDIVINDVKKIDSISTETKGQLVLMGTNMDVKFETIIHDVRQVDDKIVAAEDKLDLALEIGQQSFDELRRHMELKMEKLQEIYLTEINMLRLENQQIVLGCNKIVEYINTRKLK